MANLEFQTVAEKELTKKDYLQKINWALDNNIEVNWKSDNYRLFRDSSNAIIVECVSNGFCMGLQDSEIMDCCINKWDIRENVELRGVKVCW